MSLLDVENLSFSYDGTKLLNNVNFRLFNNDHLGIVGVNGSGKSTFLKILAGKLKQDSGSVNWLKGIKVGYLDQYKEVNNDLSVDEYLKEVYLPMYQKEKEMENFFVLGETSEKYLLKACDLQEYLLNNNFYQIKGEINKVISGLGISLSYLNKKIANLSGGEKEKVILAKLLLEEVDVLLLDEPTNFLDVEQVEWLSKYLSSYQKSFIVISHEVSFIESVCNVIWELSSLQFTRYKGDYQYYLRESALRKSQQQNAFENQQAYIKKTQDYIDRNIARASTSKMAKSRRKQLDKIEVLTPPTSAKKVNFNFLESGDSYKVVYEVENLVIGYDKPLLKPFSLQIIKNSRFVIRGENGVGKTTFVKTILGQIPALSGKVYSASNLKIGYFSQTEELDDEVTPTSYIKQNFPRMDDKQIRASLGGVGIIGKLSLAKMKTLSGGEQARVRLLRLSMQPCNTLILDEPTNHLDKASKESLVKALNKFSKTIIIISHENDFSEMIEAKEIKFSD